MPCTPKQKAVIDAAFRSIPDLTIGFSDHGHRLHQRALAEERNHRRRSPAPRGFSAETAARYFAVKWLRECVLVPAKRPALKDTLKLRADYIYAAAIAEEFATNESLRAWALSVPEDFDALDYVELMA